MTKPTRRGWRGCGAGRVARPRALAKGNMSQQLVHLQRSLTRIGGSALFGYLSLFVLQAKVLWGVWQNWDLPLWDGATYFIYARQVASSLVFPPVTWSPAFAAYYAFFHTTFNSAGPFVVYVAHRGVTLFLVLGLLYSLLRAVLPASVAWLLTACSIVLSAGLTNVFVVHVFLLIPLLVAYRAALLNSSYRNSIIILGLLVASLVRLEFVLALILVSLLLLGLDWRRSRLRQSISWRKAYGPALLIGLLLMISIQRAGPSHTPLERSWGAFEQHYAWGYQERHPEWNVDFWFKYDEAIQRSFGNAQSIGEAAVNNPREMLTHIVWNVRWLPDAFGEVLSPLPGAGWVLVVLALGALGLVVSGNTYRVTGQQFLRQRLQSILNQRYSLLVAVMACTWLPLFLSTLLIRPRTIYLLPVLPTVLLLVGVGVSTILSKLRLLHPAQSLLPIIFGLCLIGFPAPFSQPGDRVVMSIATALQDLPIVGDYALLGPSARGYCAYSNPQHCTGVEIVRVPQELDSFANYLSDIGVRVILVNKQLIDNLAPAGQSFLAQLQASPTSIGWQDAGVFGPIHLYWRAAFPANR
jgi:hypothetical protein